MMITDSPRLDAVFGALSDATRRQILVRLAGGVETTRALAEPFDMSLPAVSKHLGVLERAGLIERTLVGRERRCRLLTSPLADAAGWLEGQRGFWDHQLDRLDTFLQSSASEATPCPTPSSTRRRASRSAARSTPRASASSRRGRRSKR